MTYTQSYNEEIGDFVKGMDFSFLQNQTILLTGATGLIGSYLVDSLMYNSNLNIKIIALVRNLQKAKARFDRYIKDSRLSFVVQDIADPVNVDCHVDYVIHLASPSDARNYATYPVETMLTNFYGCKNLLDFCIKKDVKKFFFASSSEVYGQSNDPMVETNHGDVDCTDIRSCYNESKRASETLCYSYKNEYGVDFVIGRLCRVYGPTMLVNDSKALSQFILNCIEGKDIVLKSKGEQRYSYLYVSDAVAGILHLLKYGKSGEVYNISQDKDILSLKEIANHIAKLTNTKVVFNLPTDAEKLGYSRVVNSVLIADKLRSLNYEPKIKFTEGLNKTITLLKDFSK